MTWPLRLGACTVLASGRLPAKQKYSVSLRRLTIGVQRPLRKLRHGLLKVNVFFVVAHKFLEKKGKSFFAISPFSFELATLQPTFYSPSLSYRFEGIHKRIFEFVTTPQFIADHGLYCITDWLEEWIKKAEDAALSEAEKLRLGARIYSSKMRHSSAKESILKIFGVELPKKERDTSLSPPWPFVLSPRVLRVWKQLLWSLKIEQPVLLSGDEGCGKSSCITSLAYLQGMYLREMSITPETELSMFFGQLMASEDEGMQIR